jgi:hypothetical protein
MEKVALSNLQSIKKVIKVYGMTDALKALLRTDKTLSTLVDLDAADAQIVTSVEGLINTIREKIKALGKARDDERKKREDAAAIDSHYAKSAAEGIWYEYFVRTGLAEKIDSADSAVLKDSTEVYPSSSLIREFETELKKIMDFLTRINPLSKRPTSDDEVDQVRAEIQKFVNSNTWKFADLGGDPELSVLALKHRAENIGKAGIVKSEDAKRLIIEICNICEKGTKYSTTLVDKDVDNQTEYVQDAYDYFVDDLATFMYEYMYQRGVEDIIDVFVKPLIRIFLPSEYSDMRKNDIFLR